MNIRLAASDSDLYDIAVVIANLVNEPSDSIRRIVTRKYME